MINDETPEAIQTAMHLVSLSQAAAAPFKPTDHANYAHVIVPEGCKLHDISAALEKTAPTPTRKSGTIKLKSLASLIEHAKAEKAANLQSNPLQQGVLYADPDTCTITAVHNDSGLTPGWRDHRAVLKFEHTPEFLKWKGNNAQPKDQNQFAEFIEDNFADINPDHAAKLLTVATTIQATTGINFKSAKRLHDGQTQLTYNENIEAKAGADGSLTIPSTFNLALRIFKNAEPWALTARLKYRLHAGGVKFFYELDRPERVVEAAFADYIEKAKETGYPVLVGQPD